MEKNIKDIFFSDSLIDLVADDQKQLNAWQGEAISFPRTYHSSLFRRFLNRILHAYNTFLDKLAISTNEFIDSL